MLMAEDTFPFLLLSFDFSASAKLFFQSKRTGSQSNAQLFF
jgi:hypothetical protein